MKKQNERCPLQHECEKSCKFVNHERDCDYYRANSRPGFIIADQERTALPDDYETAEAVQVTKENPCQIVMIEINRLHPHPDNPRKDLGDLTELADSIKERGVLQNLTVVPWFSAITRVGCDVPKQQDEMGYRIVIGHRRHAAAKLAGLTNLPCVISSMAQREQVATMLLENMQRNDLTVYEQAQGFQMMLNLGDSVGDISKRTGFSETTVRRRVKLLELDQNKFKDADKRGATLMDFAALDKIESIERKNAVLDKIGTPNFQYELKKAIDEEKTEAQAAKWVEALSAFAAQVDDTSGYRSVKYYYVSQEPNVERPEDAGSTEYFFNISKYGSIYLLVKSDSEAAKEDPEAIRKQEQLMLRRTKLAEATARAYDLRKEFVQSVSSSALKKHIADIVSFSAFQKIDGYINLDDEMFLEMLGVVIGDDEELTLAIVSDAVSKAPEIALLCMAYCEFGDRKNTGYFENWTTKHSENGGLNMLYDLLVKIGYEMSDEEKALRDGTHELFINPEPEKKPESEQAAEADETEQDIEAEEGEQNAEA